MTLRPVAVVGGCYPDEDSAQSAQEAINWLPVRSERPGGRTEWLLRHPPGLFRLGQVGNGPHRGARDVEGKFFVVSDAGLYQVRNDFSVKYLGAIPGVGLVTMTHNQHGDGNEVIIGTGSAGYVYDTVTETLTRITDTAFRGLISSGYLGQYIVGIAQGGSFWFHSDLAEATVYSTLDRYEAESDPDALVGLLPLHGELLVMGKKTGEVFVNQPTSSAAFQRAPGILIEHGLAAPHALVKIDSAAAWMGDDKVAYLWRGNAPERISTDGLEAAWASCDPRKCFAFTYEDRGHAIVYFTFKDGKTWGYDIASRSWHRRESFGLDRWRVNTLTKWNGRWYAGDYANGNLYLLDWDYVGESVNPLTGLKYPMVRRRITGVAHADQNRLTIDELELVLSSGVASKTPDVTALWAAITVSPAMADAEKEDVVSHQYVQSGGILPGVFSISAGSLPDGLSMDADGLVTGTLTTSGTYRFTVRFTDVNGHTGDLREEVVVTARYPVLLSGLSRWRGTVAAPVAWTNHAVYVDDDANGTPKATASFSGRYLLASTADGDTAPTLFEFVDGDYVALVITGTALPSGWLSACFSPDEEWCFITAANDIYAYQQVGAGFTYRATFATGKATAYGSIACSDDFRIARCSSTKRVSVWQFDTAAYGFTLLGESTATVSAGQEERNLDWHPEGRYLAGGNATQGTSVYDSNSYPMSAVNSASNSTCGVFWNPDGTYLYTVAFSGPVRAYTWNGSALTSVATLAFGNASNAASINSARTHIACNGNTNEIRVFAVSSATITDSGNIDTGATTPDGMALLTNLTSGG